MADTNSFKPVKPPTALSRSVQRVRTTIKGVSEAWFGPMQPLRPQAQDAKGRIWDYPVAFNLNYQPRANMALSFADLQALADNCGVLRSVIETRKDQLECIDWHIGPRKVEKKTVKPSGDAQDRIKYCTQLFMSPSKETDWPQFIRQILEQHFVYDAPSLEMVPNRQGILTNIKVLDGATISVMLDADGGIPSPPYVAYQQVLKGLPAVDFTSDELLYYPRNRRAGHAYGYPHVAQIYSYVNLAIKRVSEQLTAYDGANAPHGIIEAGTNMTVDQIQTMQQYWNSIFKGNQQNRAMTWWAPPGSKYTALERDILFDEFDEWLARVICYCFSISPTPFIKQNNRATAEASQDMAQSEGTKPTMVYLKHLLDRILAKHLNSPDLEFVWDHDFETDPEKEAEITTTYVKNGIMTIDEAREDLGLDAFGGPAGEPMVITANGYTPIDPQARMDMQTEASIAARPMLPPPMGGAPGQPPGGKGGFPPKPGAGGAGKPQIGGPAAGAGKGTPPPQGATGASAAPKGAAPAQAPNQASLTVKGKNGQVQKVLTTEAIYEVERPVMNPEELVAWVKGLGLAAIEQPVLRFTSFNEPDVALDPFVLIENYPARIHKDDDGFRLYFDWAPLAERMAELGAGDQSPSILIANGIMATSDGNVLATTLDPYTGAIMFGPEEVAKRWDLAAFDADHDPSPAQQEAGNYRKGHMTFQGLNLSIENPVGSARKGHNWKVIMPHHYGYIRGTIGADGDHIDAFVGPNPDAPMVYVIDQNHAEKGSFDEHKVMLGFDTWTAAKIAYQQSYTDGKQRIGNAAMLTMDAFKHWLATGDTTLPIGVAMAKDVTMGTGLYGYDQGPVLTPMEKPKDELVEDNDVVAAGPQPTLEKRQSRWMDY